MLENKTAQIRSTSEDFSLGNQQLVGTLPVPEQGGIAQLGTNILLPIVTLLVIGYIAFRVYKSRKKKQEAAHV